jgi:CheY-like chemotaxis protein
MSYEQILVVEDDPVACKVLTSRLTDQGYQVMAAHNVPDAVHAVRVMIPDLMILDLNLRERDKSLLITNGLGFLQLLRQSHPDADCPVIVYTVDTSPEAQARARNLGVKVVIDKTHPLDELLAAVRRALAEDRSSDRLRRARTQRSASGADGRD